MMLGLVGPMMCYERGFKQHGVQDPFNILYRFLSNPSDTRRAYGCGCLRFGVPLSVEYGIDVLLTLQSNITCSAVNGPRFRLLRVLRRCLRVWWLLVSRRPDSNIARDDGVNVTGN